MSTTPSALQSGMKSFWSRPEGKTGIIVLGIGAAALLWFWGLVVPYVVSMLSDTLHMGVLGLEIAGLGYLVFGKMPRRIYRLAMRAITGLVIQIDPIGILKDNLLQAKKRRDELNSKVGEVAGSKQTLKDIIGKNKNTIQQDLAAAEQAKKMAAASKDPAQQLRMSYEIKLRTNDIARLEQSDENYGNLLAKISELYDRLVKLSAGVDFFIADLEGTVREEEVKYKVINSTTSAFKTAMKIIMGDPDENDIRDQDLQYLADSASMKLGQIDDMTRLSQHFMDGVDLQNGIMDTKAAAELDAYEQKLLTSGDQGAVSLLNGGAVVDTEAVLVKSSPATYGGYFDKK